MKDDITESLQQGIAYLSQDDETKIPIPDPSYLKKRTESNLIHGEGKMIKHGKEFDLFCKWSALPRSERNPKTAMAFETKHKLKRGIAAYFKTHKDFHKKRLEYFWEWMIDRFPDVMEAVYERAVSKKGSSVDSRIFAEMIARHIDMDKPTQQITNFTLVGVPQEQINRLFAPKGYDETLMGYEPETIQEGETDSTIPLPEPKDSDEGVQEPK